MLICVTDVPTGRHLRSSTHILGVLASRWRFQQWLTLRITLCISVSKGLQAADLLRHTLQALRQRQNIPQISGPMSAWPLKAYVHAKQHNRQPLHLKTLTEEHTSWQQDAASLNAGSDTATGQHTERIMTERSHKPCNNLVC